MSKTDKNWHKGFEDDVKWMSRAVFIRKHGIYYANFFDQYHEELQDDDSSVEPQSYWGHLEMDDGA